MASRILIQNGTLITFGSPCQVLEGQALLIEDGRIARIAPKESIPGPFDQVLDASGQLVMPGLVNGHMHFYSTLVRGLGKAAPSADFQEVLDHLWWRLDRKLNLDDVEMSAQFILLDAIRKGTTTLVDHHASPFAVTGSLDRIAKAVKAIGVRACLCYEVSDRDGEAIATEGLEENAAFARRCAAEMDPQLRALFGLHAAFTLSDRTLDRAAALGRDLGIGLPRARGRGRLRRGGQPGPARPDPGGPAARPRPPGPGQHRRPTACTSPPRTWTSWPRPAPSWPTTPSPTSTTPWASPTCRAWWPAGCGWAWAPTP